MKRITLFILAIVMLLSFSACGNENKNSGKLTKEEMLAQAEEVKISDLTNEASSNLIRAEELYDDKIIKINNFVVDSMQSYEDYATASMTYWADKNTVMIITANLSKEEIMKINKGDKVTVVGIMDVTAEVYAHINDAHIISN